MIRADAISDELRESVAPLMPSQEGLRGRPFSRTQHSVSDVDRLLQAFLRRFDVEHTFRMFKQTLGWTAPKLRTPEAQTGGSGW